ncbi:hypothetical protein EV121DRAFT_278899 [Schizophyllum commune]
MSTVEAGYSGPSLLVLPLDVLIVVQSFMKPLDIMVLQSVRLKDLQTCKALRDPTLRRTVWRDALRRVIEENDVFAPTFPSLQTMSISQLSYAALRPQVFLRRVRRCASSCPEGMIGYLEPLRRHEVQLHLHERDEDHRMFEYNPSFLIPGGRYLVVTLAYYGCLYDVREVRPTYDPILAIPAEEVNILPGPHPRKWGVCFCTPRGDDLFLFITANMETETETIPWVSAVVVARFDAQQQCYPRPLSLHSVEGEKVSFTMSTSSVAELVGVWDFARNGLAAWTCFGVLKCIIAENNLIVVTRESGILVYEIPPLEPFTTNELCDLMLAPIYIVPPPEFTHLHTVAINQSSKNGRYFELRFGENFDMADEIVRYRVVPPPPDSPNDPVALVIESIRDLSRQGPGRRSACRHTLCECDDSIIDVQYEEHCEDRASRDRTRAAIHVEPWNGEGEQETMLVDLVDRSDPLWTRESNCDLGPEVCTFCPISGRLVQMAKMYGVVVIFDYIPLPPIQEYEVVLQKSPAPSPVLRIVEGENTLAMALSRLPSELLAHVQSFLTPFDIFSLHLNVIFEPTFDQAHMSIKELRFAALRPQLFLNSVKSESSDGPDYGWPVSTREIVLETAWNYTQWEDPIIGLHLIQGGRYLLMDTHLSLCIYDMEDPLNDVERLEPIFSLDKHGNRADDDLRPTNLPASLLAYKIRGFPDEVTGEKMAQRSLIRIEELNPRSFCANDRRLAFVGHKSDIISVWDYKHNQVALLKVVDRYGSDASNGVSAFGFFTYAIPPFAPVTTPPSPLQHEAVHTIERGWIGSGLLYSTNQAGATFTGGKPASPSDPTSFLVPSLASERLNLYPDSGYDMQCCDAGTPRACVGSVFVLGHRTGWIDPDIDAQLGRRETYFERLGIPYEEWDEEDYTEEMDEAIGRENDQAGVFIHVEHRDSPRDEFGQHPTSVVELLDRSASAWGQRELRFVELCPASGRLCAIVEEGDEPPRLLVFDYLPASM